MITQFPCPFAFHKNYRQKWSPQIPLLVFCTFLKKISQKELWIFITNIYLNVSCNIFIHKLILHSTKWIRNCWVYGKICLISFAVLELPFCFAMEEWLRSASSWFTSQRNASVLTRKAEDGLYCRRKAGIELSHVKLMGKAFRNTFLYMKLFYFHKLPKTNLLSWIIHWGQSDFFSPLRSDFLTPVEDVNSSVTALSSMLGEVGLMLCSRCVPW